MNDFKYDLTALCPVKSYSPPELPALKEGRNDPVMMKKLPLRWQNNAKVVMCFGLIGTSMFTLTGCWGGRGNGGGIPGFGHHGGSAPMPIYVEQETEQEISGNNETENGTEYFVPTQVITEDLILRAHYGGSGGGPFYVVYLTEQEVMSIIRSQLEFLGLRFDAKPPDNIVEIEDDFTLAVSRYGLELFDKGKMVAIANVGPGTGSWLADHVAEGFEQQGNKFVVGTFYTPGLSPDREFGFLWNDRFVEDTWEPLEPDENEVSDAKERARPILENQLNAQIQEFIEFLISEGILR